MSDTTRSSLRVATRQDPRERGRAVQQRPRTRVQRGPERSGASRPSRSQCRNVDVRTPSAADTDDTVIPHPVYGGWLAVTNPGPRTADAVRDLLRAARHSRVPATSVGGGPYGGPSTSGRTPWQS